MSMTLDKVLNFSDSHFNLLIYNVRIAESIKWWEVTGRAHELGILADILHKVNK